jgi:hypothetical protein
VPTYEASHIDAAQPRVDLVRLLLWLNVALRHDHGHVGHDNRLELGVGDVHEGDP